MPSHVDVEPPSRLPVAVVSALVEDIERRFYDRRVRLGVDRIGLRLGRRQDGDDVSSGHVAALGVFQPGFEGGGIVGGPAQVPQRRVAIDADYDCPIVECHLRRRLNSMGTYYR